MITFDAEFKVLSKEYKSIPRRDGNGTFDFEEVKLESVDKKPTVIVARLADKDMDVYAGETYKMKICISSTLTTSGKVFNNFAVMAFQVTGGKKEEPVTPFECEVDEIPF